MLSRFELRRFRGPLPILALIFVMLVPVLYGAVYLWANWDPYGHLDRLPVAIVNEDRPAKVNDETMSAGADVTRELVDGHAFDWHETTRQDAESGLTQGRYYLVVEIPSDFSANLASAQDFDPKRAQITMRRDDANGFTIGSVTASSQGKIERAVDKATVDAYFKAVFANLAKVRSGMQKAADGAATLTKGIGDAKAGSTTLTEGIKAADAGAGKLAGGLGQLNQSMPQLTDGSSKLNAAMPQLEQGASDLNNGLGQLDTGSGTLASGAHQVADGTQQLNDKVLPVLDKVIAVQDTVATDVKAVNDAIQKLDGIVHDKAGTVSGDLTSVSTALDQAAQEDPTFAASKAYTDAKAALQRAQTRTASIESTSGTIASDADTANTRVQGFVADNKAQQAKDDLTKLNDGAHAVATGADTLHAGIGDAHTGAGKLAGGVSQVGDGVAALDAGIGKVAGAVGQLNTGAGDLKKGLDQLATGGDKLTDGLGKLADGSAQLQQGLADGVKQIPALTEEQADNAALVMSSPVDVVMDVHNPANVNGRGLAPLFFSIAMWVFGISGFLVMRPISARWLSGRTNPLRLSIAAWTPVGLVALAGASGMLAVVWGALGLDPIHPGLMIAMTALTALVFSGIAHLLRMALGLPGSAALLIWLILQLSATGGTYPAILAPEFFQVVHPFMPITYTIDAFRIAISGGPLDRLVMDAVVLVGLGAAALVLDMLAVRRAQRFRMADLHPPLG